MELGESRIVNSILRMIGTEVLNNEVEPYINNICNRDFMVMKSMKQVMDIFGNSIDEFLSCLSEEELLSLRSYTGYNFRNINAVSRYAWTYENGNEDKKREFSQLGFEISKIMNKYNMPKMDFVTFRGTTIDSFSSYGITDLSQLANLQGKYLYESGFTSTSMLEETSYYNQTINDKTYNIGIRYLIPSDCDDGVLLANTNLSYSVSQNEFVLNRGTLTKVIDVKVDEKMKTAILTVVLIPKKIYDINYNKNKMSSINK